MAAAAPAARRAGGGQAARRRHGAGAHGWGKGRRLGPRLEGGQGRARLGWRRARAGRRARGLLRRRRARAYQVPCLCCGRRFDDVTARLGEVEEGARLALREALAARARELGDVLGVVDAEVAAERVEDARCVVVERDVVTEVGYAVLRLLDQIVRGCVVRRVVVVAARRRLLGRRALLARPAAPRRAAAAAVQAAAAPMVMAVVMAMVVTSSMVADAPQHAEAPAGTGAARLAVRAVALPEPLARARVDGRERERGGRRRGDRLVGRVVELRSALDRLRRAREGGGSARGEVVGWAVRRGGREGMGVRQGQFGGLRG